MVKEAVQYARSYALEAEIKMGELLRQTERAKGAKGQLKGSTDGGRSGGYKLLPPEKTNTPTLAELGIDKQTSSRAQDGGIIAADETGKGS